MPQIAHLKQQRFFDPHQQPGPIKSVLWVIIGWLVGWLFGWLVGNAVFSETALSIFLIFCMKLGDYKGRKVTELDFWKNFLILRYSWKGLQTSWKPDTLIFFSKSALTIFSVFGLKLVINMTFNLNENYYFSEKFAIWRYLTSELSKNCPNWGFWPYFLDFASLVFLDFAHNDRWAAFLQFSCPVNVFLLSFTLYITQRFYEKTMCIYVLFDWFE